MGYELTAFEIAFGDWLTSCLPAHYTDKVISADQRGVMLDMPFATFKIIDETPLNAIAGSKLTDTPATGGAYVESVFQTMRGVASVNLYGPSAFADAQALVLEYQRFSRVAQASAAGFTIPFDSGIRRFVEQMSTESEQRAQIDFTFYVKRKRETTNYAVAEIIGNPE